MQEAAAQQCVVYYIGLDAKRRTSRDYIILCTHREILRDLFGGEQEARKFVVSCQDQAGDNGFRYAGRCAGVGEFIFDCLDEITAKFVENNPHLANEVAFLVTEKDQA